VKLKREYDRLGLRLGTVHKGSTHDFGKEVFRETSTGKSEKMGKLKRSLGRYIGAYVDGR
jgi:hypothetical protein